MESLNECAVVKAPFGNIYIYANETSIFEISINKVNAISTTITYTHLQHAVQQMQGYLKGELQNFDLPLMQTGTPFQQNCWAQLCTIAYGTTISYAQQAQILKNPLGIRAIASSNGKNNIAIVVPCHRVIGSNGSLTGYAGGLPVKQWLLQHEAQYSGKLVQGELF